MVYEYVQSFAEKLGVLDRIAQRIAKEQSGNGCGWINHEKS